MKGSTKQVVGQFVALAGGKVVAMLLTIVATVAIARVLGPSGLGQWTLFSAAGTLLHTVLVNWTHASTVRYGREEWMLTGSLNRTLGARLPLLAVSIAAAAALLVAEPGQWVDRWFAGESAEWWLIGMFALSVWLAAEAQATLQATDRISWQATIAPLIAIASVLSLLLVFAVGLRSIRWAVLAVTVVPGIGWGLSWLYALARSNTSPTGLVLEDVYRHLRFGAPVLPILALGYVSDWGDHLLLGHFSSVTQVGVFAVSYQFIAALMAANGVLTTVLLPRLIAQEVSRPGSLRRYVEDEVPTLYALWMIATIWVVAPLPAIVALLTGSAFGSSVGVLLVLLVAIPASVVTSLYTVLFNVQERMGRMLLYMLLMALTNVCVSIALIPRFGAAGAAAGTVVSYAVGQVCYMRDQHRSLGAGAAPVWMLWLAGSALGIVQLAIGPGAGLRLVWAVGATIALVALARTFCCIDRRLIDRLFGGRLRPVAFVINRTMAAKAPA
jgi:O-antigen/teichoic acid export membrane protein